MILNKNSIIIEIKKTDIKEITKLIKIIIIFDHLIKDSSFKRKKKNLKSLKDRENAEGDLDFQIIDEKNEDIKRLDVNIN